MLACFCLNLLPTASADISPRVLPVAVSPVSFAALQSLVKLARLNGTRPPQEPLALPKPQPPAANSGPGGAAGPAPKKQGLGAALRDKHIARRFFILTYAFLVMCMVSNLVGVQLQLLCLCVPVSGKPMRC
jgi:hypothetical protein